MEWRVEVEFLSRYELLWTGVYVSCSAGQWETQLEESSVSGIIFGLCL
jgi:hypothetical protein